MPTFKFTAPEGKLISEVEDFDPYSVFKGALLAAHEGDPVAVAFGTAFMLAVRSMEELDQTPTRDEFIQSVYDTADSFQSDMIKEAMEFLAEGGLEGLLEQFEQENN